MAKDGVTYEQVAEAADALVGSGAKATNRAVRERLRGGSPNVIHRHLKQWRDRAPLPSAPRRELPNVIVQRLQDELARVAAEARAEVEAELVEAQTVAADLAAAGEALEAERDALLAQVAALMSERDVLAGKTTEQGAELARLGEELDERQQTVESARIEVAQERLRTEGLRHQLEQQQPELARLRAELGREHESRIEAQRAQATLAAGRDAALERASELAAREQASQRDVLELRARLHELLNEARAQAVDVAKASESATRALSENERLRSELTTRSTELSELRAELDAVRRAAREDAIERARLEAVSKPRA
jgi:chromosome segregation ATPase